MWGFVAYKDLVRPVLGYAWHGRYAPEGQAGLWDVVTELVASGTTLLLTTQYLDEADRLADQIAVVDNGKVIGQGTADALKDRVGGDQIELTVGRRGAGEAARRIFAPLSRGDVRTDPGSLGSPATSPNTHVTGWPCGGGPPPGLIERASSLWKHGASPPARSEA